MWQGCRPSNDQLSRVVRKLVLEGEPSFNGEGSRPDGEQGALTITKRKTLGWAGSDGMFTLAVAGTVSSLTDLQGLRYGPLTL